uniref:Uncharacterized protein n=1 Tax=Rhizophora mucronata TaxID=61149 RepID=A0A2P2NQN4_RHIMU
MIAYKSTYDSTRLKSKLVEVGCMHPFSPFYSVCEPNKLYDEITNNLPLNLTSF